MSLGSREEPLAELTARAVVTGILLGIVFGAANAYLVAALVASGFLPRSAEARLPVGDGTALALAIIGLLCAFLHLASRAGPRAASEPPAGG